MNVALILSGGTGSRFGGDIPKQYMKVNNKMIIAYCLETILAHNQIDAVQIVAEEEWQDQIEECMMNMKNSFKFRGFSKPGENRQLSILNGFEDIGWYLSDENDAVLVHDAARPLLSEELITNCLSEIEGHDGVMPVIPMKDTVYLSSDGYSIDSLLNRKKIFAGQAPECFVYGKYLSANRRLMPEKILNINGSTEPAVMAGMDVVMIPGDENNFKITTKTDYDRFYSLIV